jgi:Trypsin-co-occurring domain 2
MAEERETHVTDGTEFENAGLAEAIDMLRSELQKAQDAGRSSDVRFSVGPVEVELAIEVIKKAGGEASVKVLNLLSIGGKGERSRAETNRVKIVLNPIGVNGEAFEIKSSQHRRPDAVPGGSGARPDG